MTFALRLLAVSHDAGGARALIPVAQRLQEKGVFIQAVAAGPSMALWRREAPTIPLEEVEDSLTREEAQALLIRHRINRLLSASGAFNQSEHTFRIAARVLGLPIFALLDSGLNPQERFERLSGGQKQRSWPDRVCVLDDHTFQEMRVLGFSQDQIVLTGSPNLERGIEAATSAAAQAAAAAWRQNEKVGSHELVITFFSEPFFLQPDGRPLTGEKGLMLDNGKPRYGYTSLSILEPLLQHLHAAGQNHKRPIRLIVKTHPMELAPVLEGLFSPYQGSGLKLSLVTEGTAAVWIARSDVLIGMHSNALLEAALAGKPALSVQIGLPQSGESDPCFSNQLGYSVDIQTESALAAAVEAIVQGRAAALMPGHRKPLHVEGACERVVAAVCAPLRSATARATLAHLKTNFSLETPRVLLRTLQESDVREGYAHWFENPAVQQHIAAAKLRPTLAQLKTYVRQKWEAEDGWLLGLFLRESQEHIGNLKLEPIDFERSACVLGILIGHPDWQGRGLFHEVFQALTPSLDAACGMKDYWLGVKSQNEAAVKAYRKAGFSMATPPKELFPLVFSDGIYMHYEIQFSQVADAQTVPKGSR